MLHCNRNVPALSKEVGSERTPVLFTETGLMKTVRGWGGLSSQRGATVTGFGHANRASVEWKCVKIASENVRGRESNYSFTARCTYTHMFTYAQAHTRSAPDHHTLQQLRIDKLMHTFRV